MGTFGTIKHKWTNADDDKLKKQWLDGIKAEAIAAEIGCTPQALITRRRLIGLEPRFKRTYGRKLVGNDRERFATMWNEGKAVKRIAKVFGLTPTQVQSKRVSYGLAPRTFDQGRSEKLTLRVTPEQKSGLLRRSAERGMSLSEIAAQAVARYVADESNSLVWRPGRWSQIERHELKTIYDEYHRDQNIRLFNNQMNEFCERFVRDVGSVKVSAIRFGFNKVENFE